MIGPWNSSSRSRIFRLWNRRAPLSIIPEHVFKHASAEEYNKKNDLLVGSGPYVFKKENWLRGQKLVLERNPNYWGPKPTFDKLVFVFIKNPQAAFQAFQGGEIDSDSRRIRNSGRNFPMMRTSNQSTRFTSLTGPTAGMATLAGMRKSPCLPTPRRARR